ncbi:hypothetical protein E1B28_008947 [Marasmius oreades]|uniref:Myotubularin phosphatase domain-containing protein n=1 Tax=Marasmius oreades TaxID=181124 RepID=A0A9P7RZE4_9AGAR|nr:uncharacterized protein E1B28_008947 [Marasmius oreades]KAG7092604.1 hypothetical protein E1B28_008947 [Marasmius oreades]
MDAIRISKVEDVLCTKAGAALKGTIHLTTHHLIFRYDDNKEKEMWTPYPLISLVNRLPQTLQGQCPLTFHTRTFEIFSITFTKESDASDVFESVKELTVALSVFHLYAFSYQPNPPLPTNNGWSIYSPREEFGRMGVGTRTKAWRLTDINKDYSFCPTYPSKLIVPTKISDTTLQYAAKYRSKCRIPVLTYLHWSNYASITRSSQPMVGITQNRSIQDEKLIETIFQTHHAPESRASNSPVYGATTTNLIIDARPTANAVANTAKGAGTEIMEHYKEGKKLYLGIDHIHAMRESLAKVVEALREADNLLASINNDLSGQISGVSVLDRQALRRSGWLRHLSIVLEGINIITRNVHVNSSHVLIHCSDGWDRTSQLSSLTQLCLDPFYRTIRGFEILIEKDWLSFGHKFLDRSGHLSSEKFFVSPPETNSGNTGAEAAQGFLASMQNRFASQSHIKETSPIFHQFLEAVRQIQRQAPERFEFNERFLRQLYYHLYSCQFGTFLFNTEKERRTGEGGNPPPIERTISVWDFLNSPEEMAQNMNPSYNPSLDDPTSRSPDADMGVLFPNPKDIRFWYELYGRTDDEMNGRNIPAPAIRFPDVVGLIESTEDDARVDTPSNIPLPPSPGSTPCILPAGHSPAGSDITSTLHASSSAGNPPAIAARSHPSSRDSFRPFSMSGSAFSMKTATSHPSPTSPNRPAGSRAQELLSGPGVFGRSVWDRLSSNASAALSVVQDAYGGVTKERGDPTTTETPKTEELQNRNYLTSWSEDMQQPNGAPAARVTNPSISTSPSSASHTSPNSGNPWTSMEVANNRPTLSFYDNPWDISTRSDTQQPVSATNPTQLSDDISSGSLPFDPTVVPHSMSKTIHVSPRPPLEFKTPETLEQPPRPSSSNGSTDPLGVGFGP